MKVLIPDIGELGWSLELVAHVRWLVKNQKFSQFLVVTYPDRLALYNDLTPTIELPQSFVKQFPIRNHDGLGLHGVKSAELAKYFKQEFKDRELLQGMAFSCKRFFEGRQIFEKFKASKKDDLDKKNRILIFPRCRSYSHHAVRNLPSEFYLDLITELCDRFSHFRVCAVGSLEGAYKLGIDKDNFIDMVGKTDTLQKLIDLCEQSVAAIGGTSAPPKIALMQGVPTVVIGHEEERFTKKDNWLNGRILFCPIELREYSTFNDQKCRLKIIEFVEEVVGNV